jgi:hypothetical protein
MQHATALHARLIPESADAWRQTPSACSGPIPAQAALDVGHASAPHSSVHRKGGHAPTTEILLSKPATSSRSQKVCSAQRWGGGKLDWHNCASPTIACAKHERLQRSCCAPRIGSLAHETIVLCRSELLAPVGTGHWEPANAQPGCRQLKKFLATSSLLSVRNVHCACAIRAVAAGNFCKHGKQPVWGAAGLRSQHWNLTLSHTHGKTKLAHRHRVRRLPRAVPLCDQVGPTCGVGGQGRGLIIRTS